MSAVERTSAAARPAAAGRLRTRPHPGAEPPFLFGLPRGEEKEDPVAATVPCSKHQPGLGNLEPGQVEEVAVLAEVAVLRIIGVRRLRRPLARPPQHDETIADFVHEGGPARDQPVGGDGAGGGADLEQREGQGKHSGPFRGAGAKSKEQRAKSNEQRNIGPDS